MDFWAPVPMASMVMTAPTPMRMPRNESAARTLLAIKGPEGLIKILLYPFGVEEYFNQAFRALMANKVRAALSFLGILIGVGAVITMLAIGTGAQKSMQEQMASLGTNLIVLVPGSIQVGGIQQGTGSWSRILPQYALAMAEVPMVKAVAPEVTGRVQTTYADQNWNTLLSGTAPSYAEMRDAEPIYGRFINNDDVARRKRVCLLGMTVIKQLFGNANPIGEEMKINRVSFQVIGILPVKGSNGFQDRDDLILVPYTTAMHRLFGKLYVNQVDIEVDKLEDTDACGDAAKAYMMKLTNIPNLPGNENTYMVRNMADIQAMFTNMTKIMTLLLSCVAAISLLVGGIGIMNIMLVSVTTNEGNRASQGYWSPTLGYSFAVSHRGHDHQPDGWGG